MNSRLASAVDPVILYVLHSLQQLDNGQQLEPESLASGIQQRLAAGDARLGLEPQWCLAKYALVAWIDEMLVNHAWTGSQWWSNNVLEAQLFQSRICSVRYYELAREACKTSQRDALEVFYQCVILGFRGMYGPAGDVAEPAHSLGFPSALTAWLVSMERMLAEGHLTLNEASSVTSVVSAGDISWGDISGAPADRSRQQAVLWSLAVVVLLAINWIVYQWDGIGFDQL